MPKAAEPSDPTNAIGNLIGDRHLQSPTLPVSAEFLISLATGPLLLGILSAKSLSEVVQQIGLASEEMFRGERLPVLKMPIPGSNDNDSLQE